MVNDTIQRLEKLLKEKITDGLEVSNTKTLKFYLQRKIYKRNNPGPSVVVICHTSSISKYVDYHLPPIVKYMSSYVQDTKDFLTKLNHVKLIPKQGLFVTLDVKSLYTNITNNESIKNVIKLHDKQSSKSISTKIIITFLSLILTLNNFIFNRSRYLQVMGCADNDYTVRLLRSHTLMTFPGLSLVLRGLITFEWSTVTLWLILGCPEKFYTHSELPSNPRSLSEHYSVVRGSPPSVTSERSRRITSSEYLGLISGFRFKYWLIDNFFQIFMLMCLILVISYFLIDD